MSEADGGIFGALVFGCIVVVFICAMCGHGFRMYENKIHPKKTNENVICPAPESESTKDWYEDLKIETLNGDSIEKLKQVHDEVIKAIYSIPPKMRENTSSYPLWMVDPNNSEKDLKKAELQIIQWIQADLKLATLPQSLERKIHRVFSTQQVSKVIKESKEEYCEIDLNPDWGGTSYIRVGMIGMKRINDNEVMMGAALYFEKWVEYSCVRINIKHKVWKKENVKKFAKYLLYKDIENKMKQLEQKTQQKLTSKLVKEHGLELYTWLKSINHEEYYKNFKDAGYEKRETIAKISEETLTYVIRIKKPGHIQDFMIEIPKLKPQIETYTYQ